MKRPTVYRVFDSDDRLIYVGVTASGARFDQLRCERRWWAEADRIALQHFTTWEEAVEAEQAAILAEYPRYNIYRGRASTDNVAIRASAMKRQRVMDTVPNLIGYITKRRAELTPWDQIAAEVARRAGVTDLSAVTMRQLAVEQEEIPPALSPAADGSAA